MSTNKPVRTSLKNGFTIVELLIIAPIVILTIGAFVTVIVNMTGDVLASRAANVLTYNVQDALDRIEADVKLSSSFLAESNISLTSPQGYDNDTTSFANADDTKGNMLVLSTLPTTTNPISTSAGLVYLDDLPNDCNSSQVNQNTPLTANVIYFVKDGALWRRMVMSGNYDTAGCSVPWQQPSCNPTYMSDNPSSSTFCKTQDVKLLDDVTISDFVIQYYNAANAVTPDSVAGNSTEDVEDRNTALSSSTTIGVTISVHTTAAGRDISQSGTIRATKLDINASTIAAPFVATVPSTPTVTGNVVSGENANFSWPISSGGDVTYDVDYNIDGGAWNNVLNDTTNLTYSRIAVRGQTVNLRVVATNTAGSSSYGTTSTTIPLWNSPLLQNNWTNYDPPTHSTFGFTKTSAGLVMLKGLIKRTGSAAVNEVIATLPEGFRPPTLLMFQVITAGAAGRLYVATNGEISVINLSVSWLSMQDLSFISSTAGYTPTTLSTVAPWVNFVGPPAYDLATSVTDSSGRVNILGMLKNGSTASEVNMVAFAAGTAPNKRVYLPTPSGTGTYSLMVGDTSGFMKTALTSAAYTGINSKFYPGSRPDGTDCTTSWCSLTVGASWVPYGAVGSVWAQPQYTKGSDGVVMLRGLIKNGVTSGGTTLATLPSGYRPKEHYIFQVNAGGGIGRIDVFPTGIVQIQQASTAYTSLDNIYFIAE